MLSIAFTLPGAGIVRAQDATPGASPAAGVVALPAHIHSGHCDALGDVRFPLDDVTLAPAADASLRGKRAPPRD